MPNRRRFIRILESGNTTPPFVGFLDNIPNIIDVWYLIRTLSSYTGDCLRIRRSSDDTAANFGFTSNGLVDVAAIQTFIGVGHGFISGWYSQTGSGRDFIQLTSSKQPEFIPDRGDGLPTIAFDGINDQMDTGSQGVVYNMPMTSYIAIDTTSLGVGKYWLGSATAATNILAGRASLTNLEVGDGNTTFLPTYSSGLHVFKFKKNSTTSKWRDNMGTELINQDGGTRQPDGFSLGNATGFSVFAQVNIPGLIAISGEPNTTNDEYIQNTMIDQWN